MDAVDSGRVPGRVCLVISNNSDSEAIERARRARIRTLHLSRHTHPDPVELDQAMCDALERYSVDVVLCLGYLRKVGPTTLARFGDRVLNVHPALLPRYGGVGMYGMAVHEAVIAAGETESGVTVHVVTEGYDEGPIVAQRRVRVLAGDDAAILAKRVQATEIELLIEVIESLARAKP
jgi:phosphoribosylglycinamide formyltransferase 1